MCFLKWLVAAIIFAFLPVHAADMFVYFGTHRFGTNLDFSLAQFETDTGDPVSVPYPCAEQFLPVR